MTERRYLPTFSDLADRLSIVLLKSIFIAENRDAYREEMELIKHDIAGLRKVFTPDDIYALMVLTLSNRVIWENESKARLGGDEQDRLLKHSHAINGIRNVAKNRLAKGERIDLKVDSLAASLPADIYGDWRVFE